MLTLVNTRTRCVYLLPFDLQARLLIGRERPLPGLLFIPKAKLRAYSMLFLTIAKCNFLSTLWLGASRGPPRRPHQDAYAPCHIHLIVNVREPTLQALVASK
jgi:hypothetical protein